MGGGGEVYCTGSNEKQLGANQVRQKYNMIMKQLKTKDSYEDTCLTCMSVIEGEARRCVRLTQSTMFQRVYMNKCTPTELYVPTCTHYTRAHTHAHHRAQFLVSNGFPFFSITHMDSFIYLTTPKTCTVNGNFISEHDYIKNVS